MTYEQLLNDAIDAMTALQESLMPHGDCPGYAVAPPTALRGFVDAHARLLFERAQLHRTDLEAAGQQSLFSNTRDLIGEGPSIEAGDLP
ncbi:MAG: hypothetical protein JWL63_3236 [Rhodocyclales bacterium]|nr:hypothetical protein [Rhodocyclales bacterium]